MKDFKSLEVGDYFRILWRRKWYFICVTPLVIAGAIVYAWGQPLIYRSEVRIQVEAPPVPEDLVRSSVRMRPQDRLNMIRSQIQSRMFIERLVEQYRLSGYGADPGFSMERAVASARQSIQIVIASDSTFTLSFVARDPEGARDITQRLAEMLVEAGSKVRRDRADDADRFIEEQLRNAERDLLTHEDKIKQFKIKHLGELPEQAAANLNVLSGLITQLAGVDSALERAREQLKALDFRLQEQKRLAVLSENLQPAQTAALKPEIQEDPAHHQLASELAAKKAQLTELASKYTDKHPDVLRLGREVQELERQLAAVSSPADNSKKGAAATEMTPLGQPEKPAESASAPAPDDGRSVMFELAEAEIRSETEKVNNQIVKFEKQKDEIGRQMKTVQDRLNLAPALEQELLALTRGEEVLREQYSTLQNKKFSTKMAKTLETDPKTEFYSIIDPATLPLKPIFPDRRQMVLIGIGAGLLMGLGAAFGREFFDSSMGSEEEAMAVLSLPVLASVPEIPPLSGKGGPVKRIKSAA